MFVRAAVFGRLKPAMQAEMRAVAGALRRAVVTTGGEVQSELRAQVRSAGFKDGGRSIANAWRLNLYPAAPAASGGISRRIYRRGVRCTTIWTSGTTMAR